MAQALIVFYPTTCCKERKVSGVPPADSGFSNLFGPILRSGGTCYLLFPAYPGLVPLWLNYYKVLQSEKY